MRVRCLPALVVAVLLLFSLLFETRRANAEDKAAAAALYDEGVALMKANDYPAACAKFRDSIAASPGLGAMLWLGDCYQKSGRTASAWAQFRQAAALAAEKNDPREKVAAKRVEELEPTLAHLIVVVKGAPPPGLEVTRDGVALSAASFGVPIPIDPGDHVIRATAKNYRPWTENAPVGVRGTTQVVIPPLEVQPATAATTTTPGTTTTAPVDEGRGDNQRLIGLGVGGFGLVAAGVGVFYGLRASSKLDESNDGHCKEPGDVCDTRGLALRSEASDAATISTIAIGVGAAAVVAGAVLFFTAPRASRQSRARTRITPTFVGLGFATSWE